MACAIGLSRILREDRATKDGLFEDGCSVACLEITPSPHDKMTGFPATGYHRDRKRIKPADS